MIQGNVEALDTSAASILGLEPVRHVGHPTTATAKVEALQIDGLTVQDHQGVTRLDNFTLTVDRGEIVGVAGVEGNGQSELTAVLAGMMAATEGRIYLGGDRSHRTFAEGNHRRRRRHRAGGSPCGRLRARHQPCGEHLPQPAPRIHPLRLPPSRRAGTRGIRADAAASTCAPAGPARCSPSLSGGNQQKAVLAREITLPNLSCLVAAQPTRGLDVGAVAAVYSHIRDGLRPRRRGPAGIVRAR